VNAMGMKVMYTVGQSKTRICPEGVERVVSAGAKIRRDERFKWSPIDRASLDSPTLSTDLF